MGKLPARVRAVLWDVRRCVLVGLWEEGPVQALVGGLWKASKKLHSPLKHWDALDWGNGSKPGCVPFKQWDARDWGDSHCSSLGSKGSKQWQYFQHIPK